MIGVLMQRGSINTETDTYRHKETRRTAATSQGMSKATRSSERDVEPNGTKPALNLNFHPPELQNNKFLLFKLPSLWHFGMAALVNEYTTVHPLALRGVEDQNEQTTNQQQQQKPLQDKKEMVSMCLLQGHNAPSSHKQGLVRTSLTNSSES